MNYRTRLGACESRRAHLPNDQAFRRKGFGLGMMYTWHIHIQRSCFSIGTEKGGLNNLRLQPKLNTRPPYVYKNLGSARQLLGTIKTPHSMLQSKI
jgi:hypothetical protein